ncbi:dff1e2e8-a30a-4124-99bc-9614e19cb34d [Sclerotinia trifoliorum]|uniref:Dff1e2e8-a30a-4124-99bc-9614e19cb34d n=1 Tax=Sclerotinia trifoliorum TaxID=28548 RepID=A0A8H2W3X2_9HELO|nr:dff1e2e8-a30a-4124-99bc-9614e19cb34d [Sclerotinia trifoliorum]
MITINLVLLFSFLSSLVSAHFSLEYPPSRGNSFLPPASQWIYPCANINTTENRTLYPTSSFPIGLNLHHHWTYIFVNLALGTNGSSNFNISLTPAPLNATGSGHLCLSDFDLPSEIKLEDGLNATVQVVTVGESGSALYNCADITFSSNTTALHASDNSTQCPTSPNITVTKLSDKSTCPTESSSTTTSSARASSSTSSGTKNSGISLSATLVLMSALGVARLLVI